MKPGSQDNKSNPPPMAIGNLLRKAQLVCDDALGEPKLMREMELVSANLEHLTPEQRRKLQEIGQIMTAASAKPIKGMDQPGEFTLQLSEDRLHMLLSVTPPLAGGKPVATTDVIEALRQQGIEKGVMLGEIQKSLQAAKSGQEVTSVAVVRGISARPGSDAFIELMGRTAVNRPMEKLPGSAILNLNQLNIICVKDDVVAIYHPPVPGTPGYDALGQVLEPPATADMVVEAGNNILRQGNEFVAQITGMLQYDGRTLSVRPVLLFPRDVTTEAGDIHFDGEIMVNGTVRSGVNMVASGDINIQGNVEAARIKSLGGSVRIGQGIVGRGEAVIVAEGDISTKFVENATLRAQGDIHIENGAMHSSLVAGKVIAMTHGKGQLIGGLALAGQRVSVRILGTPSSLLTEVSVGLSAKAMKVLSKIDLKRRGLKASLDQCTPLIERIYKMVTDPLKLDKASLQTLSNLKQVQFVLQLKLSRYDARRERVMASAAKDTSGVVEVHDAVETGVIIHIGNAVLDNKATAQRRQFVYDTQSRRIISKPLK